MKIKAFSKGTDAALYFIALLFIMLSVHLSSIALASLRRSPIVIAVEKVSPAVVNISTTVHEHVRPFFPFSRDDGSIPAQVWVQG
jgi:hypothetical protein